MLRMGRSRKYSFEVLLCVRSYLIVIAHFYIIKMNLLFSLITFKYSTFFEESVMLKLTLIGFLTQIISIKLINFQKLDQKNELKLGIV